MLAIDSRVKALLGAGWLVFAGVNSYLTFALAGQETIPYHLIWASFALLYGLCPWPKVLTRIVFTLITVVTGIALIGHAASGIIGWEECSETVLMGLIMALVVWHVNRQWAARELLLTLQADERQRTEKREIAARFGSHEVRTRLTIARGYAQLIADQSTDSAVRADANLVVSELVKASALATNLLTLVRVVQPSPRSPFDVDQLIQVVMRRWSVTATRRWSATSNAGVILGDSERLEATLDCLLENAVKFTQSDDVIAVTASLDSGHLILSVSDSGAGIPDTDVDTIFELFKTSSSAGDRAGSGLGLAIVRAIIEARGGTVQVNSTVGVGTTFVLSYPLSARATAADREMSYRAHQDPTGSFTAGPLIPHQLPEAAAVNS